MLKITKQFIAIGLLSFACAAQADPITWTLNNVTFGSGGDLLSLQGSFTYDVDTFNVSSFDIKMYNASNNLVGSTNDLDVFGPTVVGYGDFSPFTGFTLFLNSNSSFMQGLPTDIDFGVLGSFTVNAIDTNKGGSLQPSAVPVPAAAWLFGSAVLGFFGVGRQRKIASI